MVNNSNAVAVANSVRKLEEVPGVMGSPARLPTPDSAAIMEEVIVKGDLKALEPADRAQYYIAVCQSMGLNPLTKPFEYIDLDGKLTLYATRGATDQLRKLHRVDCTIVSRELVDGVYVVTARATLPDGRTDESIGAVPLVKEGGEWKTATSGKRYFQGDGKFSSLAPADRANAMMKAESKAKRRVILSAVGLGWIEQSELETMPRANTVIVDSDTGEILSDGPTAPGSITTATMREIHGEAKKRNIPHEELSLSAQSNFDINTMRDLSEVQGVKLLEEIKRVAVPDQPERDWLAEIDELPIEAASLPKLAMLGTAMKNAGITRTTHPEAFAVYTERQTAMRDAAKEEAAAAS